MKKSRKLWTFVLSITFVLAMTACGAKEEKEVITTIENKESVTDTKMLESEKRIFPYEFQDSNGKEVKVEKVDRVVILYGSFAEIWQLAGGKLVGTTKDAIEERKMVLGEETEIVGTVKDPNLEQILALNPDFVIMSADIAAQTALEESLDEMQIPNASMRVDTFEDYLKFLRIACDMTEREELYQENGIKVKEQIEQILAKIPKDEEKKVLLLRAYSTGIKAKTDDNFTGVILENLGLTNIAKKYPSLLEDMSIEEVIMEDPDFIFVITMGAEEKALQALKDSVESDPAWNALKAVKNEHYIILPKELFHYKPNAKWAESYEYLAKIIYPEIFYP